MTIYEPGIYHIYNRGNNQQTVFFSDENYLYFLRKCHKYLKPVSDVLAWCLMPNHFHFLVNVTEQGLAPVKSGNIHMPAITNGFRLLESSYAKGINKQLNRTGNLFQQKTKSKLISSETNYPNHAFHYIHQNPVNAGLVIKSEDWVYSSYCDYIGLRKGTLCNIAKAYELLNLTQIDFKKSGDEKINPDMIKNLF